jgi:hypothetical protein
MAWSIITIDGKNFNFYHQTLHVECGPSCAAMVAAAMGRGLSMNDSRNIVRSVEKNQGGFNQNWNQDYTNDMSSLVHVLAARGIRDAMFSTPGNLDAYLIKLRNCSPSRPAILRVYRPYGHFIVCVGKSTEAGIFNLMDPELVAGHVKINTNSDNGYLGYRRNETWYYLDVNRIITTN